MNRSISTYKKIGLVVLCMGVIHSNASEPSGGNNKSLKDRMGDNALRIGENILTYTVVGVLAYIIQSRIIPAYFPSQKSSTPTQETAATIPTTEQVNAMIELGKLQIERQKLENEKAKKEAPTNLLIAQAKRNKILILEQQENHNDEKLRLEKYKLELENAKNFRVEYEACINKPLHIPEECAWYKASEKNSLILVRSLQNEQVKRLQSTQNGLRYE